MVLAGSWEMHFRIVSPLALPLTCSLSFTSSTKDNGAKSLLLNHIKTLFRGGGGGFSIHLL